MIVVRDVFFAKYGHGDELVALFKEMESMAPDLGPGWRILVDLSGKFFQVVTEMEVENLAAWERMMGEEMGDPRFADWFERMKMITNGGTREFYRIVP